MSVSKEEIQKILQDTLELLDIQVRCALKNTGNTSETSQQQCILNKIQDVSYAINGIEQEDIRVENISGIPA